jgi:NADH:ubiquinone oxidoreductase subunit K
MLGVITITEVLAGILCGIGIFEILFFKTAYLSLIGAELSALTLIMLFFGQRIAQDYAGAGNLVPYFILSLLAIVIFYGFNLTASFAQKASQLTKPLSLF